MKTSIEEVKKKVELEHREALNLLCTIYGMWHLKDSLISILANCYCMGAIDTSKEALCQK